jgi:hypothetical protein
VNREWTPINANEKTLLASIRVHSRFKFSKRAFFADFASIPTPNADIAKKNRPVAGFMFGWGTRIRT